MFTLAHLSDPHIPPLPVPRFSELLSKRLFGFINWQKKRRDIHRFETLERLVADIKKQSPDHIAVTGDLINLSLPDEFPQARLWLNRLGSAVDVTLIAGNHDAYVRKMEDEPKRAWSEYMRGDGETQTSFPFVRKRGPTAIVGLSTSVASGWSKATGKLGKVQLAALPAILKRLGEEGLFRIVSLHHPPQSEPNRKSQRLLDGQDFLATIAQAGADLIIHGHDHIHQVSWVDGAGRRVPVVGVPSASAGPADPHSPGGYNLYAIERAGSGWHCIETSCGFTADGAIAERGRVVLAG
jgi:3',5'-cyclic AMP phosphodiesterase CpdA